MATYWISFHIAKDSSYSDRYDELHEVVANLAMNEWWNETTSFVLFESDASIDHISNMLSLAINQRTDTVLIGQTEYKRMRLVGLKRDYAVLEGLVPFVK